MVLDDYKDNQFIAYSLLKSSILNDRLSHAYLIDANNNESAFDFVLAFVKMIVCPNHYSNSSSVSCDDCNICKRIENHNYPEIKVIETESLIIKKEQLLELQSDFSKTGIEGIYRIYIIKDCDKMNKQASNCLLKFLEEPVPGVIAILVTNHFSRILSTIISRCQVIRLANVLLLNGNSSLENFSLLCCDRKEDIISFQEDDSKKLLINTVLSFLDYFEENGLDILIYMKKMWYTNIQSREDTIMAFLLMLYFYYDILKFKIHDGHYFFCDVLDLLENVADKNTINTIIHKIEIISYGYEMLQCNLNVNLLMDDIIIKLGGDIHEYC